MKKSVIAAIVFLLLSASCALAMVPDKPDTFAYAYDFDAGVFSAADIEEISRYGAALEGATGIQVIAVAVDFLDGMDPADYATDLINTWGIGNQDDEGVVILLSRGDRKIQIGTGTGIDRVMTGGKCGELIDNRISYFANDQFAAGMTALYADVCEFLAKAKGVSLLSGAESAEADTAVNRATISQNAASENNLNEVILEIITLYCFIGFFVHSALIRSENDGGWLRILFPKGLFKVISAMVGGIVVCFLLAPFAALFGGAIDDNSSDNDSSRSSGGSRGGGGRGFGGGGSRGGGGGRSF